MHEDKMRNAHLPRSFVWVTERGIPMSVIRTSGVNDVFSRVCGAASDASSTALSSFPTIPQQQQLPLAPHMGSQHAPSWKDPFYLYPFLVSRNRQRGQRTLLQRQGCLSESLLTTPAHFTPSRTLRNTHSD